MLGFVFVSAADTRRRSCRIVNGCSRIPISLQPSVIYKRLREGEEQGSLTNRLFYPCPAVPNTHSRTSPPGSYLPPLLLVVTQLEVTPDSSFSLLYTKNNMLRQ